MKNKLLLRKNDFVRKWISLLSLKNLKLNVICNAMQAEIRTMNALINAEVLYK